MQRINAIALGLIVPLLVGSVWQVASANQWLPEQLLPAPILVWESLRDLWREGELQLHVSVSLSRLAASLAIGVALGVLLGVAMALSAQFKRWVFPSFNLLAQFPVIGWVPILVIAVGIDEALKISAIALAVVAPVTLNVYRGIVQIPRQLLEAADVLQLSIVDVFSRLIIPATLPNIFSGLRQGVMQAWLTLVFVELLASSEGIGYIMVWGRQLMQLDLIVVGMIVIGAVGYCMDALLSRLEVVLQPWQIRASLQSAQTKPAASANASIPVAPVVVAASVAARHSRKKNVLVGEP